MDDLFRIESPRVTLTWAQLTKPPAVVGNMGQQGCLIVSTKQPFGVKPTYPGTIGPMLYEQVDYRLSAKVKSGQGAQVEIRHRDPNIICGILPIDEDDNTQVVGTLNFRNQVGRSRFDIYVDDQHELSFEIEVFPAKLDYRSDYEQILAEVQSILTGLAFEYLQATYTTGMGGDQAPTELEWTLLLRHLIDDLEQAARYITLHPVRTVRRDVRSMRVEKIYRVDSVVRRAVATQSGCGERLPLMEGIHVRQLIPTVSTELSLDTHEHRWIKGQLSRVRVKLASLIATESSSTTITPRRQKILTELCSMERRTIGLLKLEPFQIESNHLPARFASLQLMRASGYREAYRALIALQLGLRLEGNALELSLKDISTLYEYWCYLALLDIISQKTGVKVDSRQLIAVNASGLQVLLQKGRSSSSRFDLKDGRKVEVLFNPKYQGNVLLAQQPDIVVELGNMSLPNTRIVIDAKYRVDGTEDNQRLLGLPGPPADAINVLHRYRDAILAEEKTPDDARRLSRNVVFASALYPYHDRDKRFPTSRLSRQLKSVGIGAIPFLPTESGYVDEWIGRILQASQWELAQSAIPAAPEPWVWSAANEAVLIGVLRSSNKAQAAEHLEWIKSSHCYYIPLTEALHNRQWNVKHIGLYVPQTLRGEDAGAVTLIGTVSSISQVTRNSIDTPWQPRSTGGHVLLYKVAGWQPLRVPIRNATGSRFSQPRWSNKLALERSLTIDQLFLESPLEWMLYDVLVRNAFNFKVQANQIKTLGGDIISGRARFLLQDSHVVTYEGRDGFRVSGYSSKTSIPTIEKVISHLLAAVTV